MLEKLQMELMMLAENILNVSISVSKNSGNAKEVTTSANQLAVISKNLMKVVSIFNIRRQIIKVQTNSFITK